MNVLYYSSNKFSFSSPWSPSIERWGAILFNLTRQVECSILYSMIVEVNMKFKLIANGLELMEERVKIPWYYGCSYQVVSKRGHQCDLFAFHPRPINHIIRFLLKIEEWCFWLKKGRLLPRHRRKFSRRMYYRAGTTTII